ncbi:hypothetical protein S40285_09686 [Stachybotrys chlorohalonatus IBT 40285]|uniref:NAD-dependent epimerase/dehydratase domain-containing protein n=1 Tax=Stachybotrys chlorohalonatus (strain IBT 40285) TaxID=1283841 RepID=A0A084QW23_STAC4|nr:hypothetical protein S40285_09686 [Stachybotrys chlorohalonata IBT 40285]
MLAKDLAAQGVRTVIMRLAAVNHGNDGQPSFASILTSTARAKSISAYIDDGLNQWPAVHILDTAVAYRLALEKAVAGSSYHIVAEEGVKIKDLAEVIGGKLGVPTNSLTLAKAIS